MFSTRARRSCKSAPARFASAASNSGFPASIAARAASASTFGTASKSPSNVDAANPACPTTAAISRQVLSSAFRAIVTPNSARCASMSAANTSGRSACPKFASSRRVFAVRPANLRHVLTNRNQPLLAQRPIIQLANRSQHPQPLRLLQMPGSHATLFRSPALQPQLSRHHHALLDKRPQIPTPQDRTARHMIPARAQHRIRIHPRLQRPPRRRPHLALTLRQR